MAEFETHPREVGPSLVTAGLAGGPAIMVFDPDGLAKHDDVPASWHHLLWRHQVLWCRLPAMDSLAEATQKTHELAAARLPLDVVAGGTGAAVAVDFCQAHRPRSLLLVDPGTVPESVSRLHDDGVRISVLGTEGEPEPRTLGHPDVVVAVTDLVGESGEFGGVGGGLP
ncbi:hypothetical protein [Haloechinothrix halophila]|uniref:hypothetical protein n=1 Tax=Haloechinothrix halophila TaxID=1069073 RepID=UPI00042A3332|nr:hypothetical protein [Haloechinothrix halophila]